jgi:predicted membrane chloride channel (bestrophin family)
MIEYSSGSFGFQLLSLRLDGSAVFKSIAPSILSSIVYVVLYINYDNVHFNNDNTYNNEPILIHPYPMGALIAALTFLLTFRANFSYNRYWEAVTAVHTMHSRWLDAATQATAFHLQSSIYDKMKPQSFGNNNNKHNQPNSSTVQQNNSNYKNTKTVSTTRSRTRTNEPTLEELEILIDTIEQTQRELDSNEEEEVPVTAAAALATADASETASNGITIQHDSTNTMASPMSRAFANIMNRITPKNDIINEQKLDHSTTEIPIQQQEEQQSSEDNSNYNNNTISTSIPHNTRTTTSVLNSETSLQPPITNNSSRKQRKVKFMHSFSFGRDSEFSDKTDHNEHHNNNENVTDEQKQNHYVIQQTKSSSIPKHSIVSVETTMEIWKSQYTPIYLRELAHLISLLSAVALSGLRNDIAGCESPLAVFIPGAPWPHVDPNSYSANVRKSWSGTKNRYWELVKYLVNISRTPEARTLYNAARPFRVIGGISDNEVLFLQAAKNPSAKVSLVFMWVIEYITREGRYGATGAIAPPILSRTYQVLSDGMTSYNQARKVAYVPFPFPHAQITALYTLLVTFFMPVLMLQFVTNLSFGFILNFLTVMCFTGLQEVSRELESPFLNEPNDIPLNNYQAQFNESLLVMFAGYHPDFYD